jgi:hypothetical protein
MGLPLHVVMRRKARRTGLLLLGTALAPRSFRAILVIHGGLAG